MQGNNNQVVITGASSGIGAEFAKQFAMLGADLTIIARREERLKELSQELHKLGAANVKVIITDLANSKDLTALAQALSNSKVEILINNAGIGSFGMLETLDAAREKELNAVNTVAPLILTHAVIPQMKQRRSGRIVNISSIAGFQPLPYMATYGATKAFLTSFSFAIRNELRPYGITVTVICPGPVATEFGGVARVPGEFTNIHRDSVELVVSQSIKAIMAGQAVCVPGVRSWGLSILSRILPLVLTTRITEWMLRGALQATNKRS